MTVKLLGVPYDAHSSFLRGPALAPAAIREALTCGAANWCTESGLDLDPAINDDWVDLGDLDALDPAFAPGVSHHEPGGLSTRQLLDALRQIGESDAVVVGADLVELNPVRDVNDVTAMVAAKLMRELLGLLVWSSAQRRIDPRGADCGTTSEQAGPSVDAPDGATLGSFPALAWWFGKSPHGYLAFLKDPSVGRRLL